jgi:hypothetical protein
LGGVKDLPERMSDEFGAITIRGLRCSFVRGSEPVARGQHLVRIPIVREMLKRLAPKGDLFFLHYLDVLPPDGGDRFTQSECPLGQL